MDFIVSNKIKEDHDFIWAVTQMKKSKKVIRSGLDAVHYLSGEDIYWEWKNKNPSDNPYPVIKTTDVLATDWEIYEKEDKETKWNLADREHFNFHKDDIKTFIQKVKEDKVEKEKTITSSQEGDEGFKAGMQYVLNKMDKRAGDL